MRATEMFPLKSLYLVATVELVFASQGLADVVDYWRFEEGGGAFVADQTKLATGTANSVNWSSDVPNAVIPQGC